MVSHINQEFLSMCNSRHVLGAALTPRHQGLCERNHQTMMSHQLILMQSVCRAHPQEWPTLVPVVEYVQHTAPQGAHGFSAHDMSCAHPIITDMEAKLAPFRIPQGVPESDHVAKLFSNFRSIFGMFTRINREQ